MDLGLAGRLAVVTGASKGIGAATADALVAEGAEVVRVSRGGEGGEAVDITAPDAVERLEATLPRAPDILINNAGTSQITPLDELTEEDWQRQWELNVLGPMRLMRAFAPRMADSGWGRIVNVSSSSGRRPSATNMAYSVTKAAELALSRAFADLYAAQNVLVNAVAPGVVASDLWTAPGGMADQLAEQRGITREEALEQTGAKPPRGRFGEPEEIAAAIVFLCSERAANVAGAAWSVDGGTVPTI